MPSSDTYFKKGHPDFVPSESRKKQGLKIKGNKFNLGRKRPNIEKTKISKTCKLKGIGKWMKGRHLDKYKMWKGDNVGYFSLHNWIKRWYGNPKCCVDCGLIGGESRQKMEYRLEQLRSSIQKKQRRLRWQVPKMS